ncbi:RND family transporter [Mycobacterium decipiens]|uniref:MMPL family RND transporter n=1 Tax=Mycobacterium decipiens TaxID=1430326 RepID=A0A1X2LUA2_9MYCO|nr:RND family transporter [Mycobacterium decipiens]OSC39888.1 MMPL family RND transporter [Mycobacterium decipiens]
MTAIGRFIHRYALWIVVVWTLAAIIANGFAVPLEQVITAEDQPFSPSGTATSLAVQRSAAAFGEMPGDNTGYLVLERNESLNDQDRAFYDQLVAALRADSRHVIEVVDWWGVPAMKDAVRSEDHRAVTAALRFGGMVGTSQARESIAVVRNIVAQLHPPDGLHVFVTGAGATIVDEFAAIDRQMPFITTMTIAALLFLLLIVYRSLITAMVPLLSVVVALAVDKPIVSVLVQREVIEVSLFSVGLGIAVVVGTGTGFAIFLIGRYHERRRQSVAPAAALADAYRGVAPAIVGSTLIVVTPLVAMGWVSLAWIGMFATTGVLCFIGVLTVGLAALTLTPALIALASRANLLEPPRDERIQRRFRRIGTHVARWPAPILIGSGVFVFILMLALPGVPIGWDEAAATPAAAESNRGYRAAERHFAPNQLLPTVVTIETDHDIRNPTGLTAIERITAAIMGIPGVRMVRSASHPNGLVSKQAALTTTAGNLGDQLDAFSDRLTSREATFANLETALRDVVSALDLLQTGVRQDAYGIGQVSLAVRLMQDALIKLQGDAADVYDIFDPLRGFVAAIPDCGDNLVCSAAQEVVQWANTVVESCTKLVDAAGQLARGIADAASATSGVPGLANALNSASGELAQVRASAAGLKEILSNVGVAPLGELPEYLHELAAASQDAPGVDLHAARKILTDPNMRPALDYFVSPNGHATRLLVYGDRSEWGNDGAQQARAIVAVVQEETKEDTLKPTAVELTGVGPATRDLQDLVGRDLALLAVITFAVILAIAALLLRSPLAGLVVLATIAASYICALGASVLIWKHILGHDLHWSVLPIAFVLLIAVGSGCNLLFALRIREELPAGPRTSIIRAFATTGAVVTAAGIVLGTTMFALAASSVLSVAQIGVAVGSGLVLDALVMRSFVLPALMVVLGRWLWWPRKSVSTGQLPEPVAIQ